MNASTAVKTTVERVDETTVKLSITVEADRVDAAYAEAARHMAADVKVPGFRPGRVPKKVLERRLGKAAIAQHAIRDALPTFYGEAVEAEDLDVVGPPEFDVDLFEEGKQGSFTAQVQVRPEFDVPEYTGREITHPEWEVTEEELTEQLDGLRERFAELETVEREVRTGDHARITVTGTKDGEPDEEASGEDLLYEVGDPSETDAEIDRQLLGSEAGAILRFSDTLGSDYGERAGEELDFTVIVKEVKAKTLPELDDDFAITASEFDTAEELVEAVRTGLARQKRAMARQNLRSKVVEEIAADIDIPLPAVMVDEELRFRIARIAGEAERHGVDFAQYLQATGMDAEELQEVLREQAEQTVKAQLVVDAIGSAAGITISNDDLGAEVARQAMRLGRPIEEVAEQMNTQERVQALAADAFRRKSIDHILESVEIASPPPDDDTDLDPLPEVQEAEAGDAPDTGEASEPAAEGPAPAADDESAEASEDEEAATS
jgi:trigger factor